MNEKNRISQLSENWGGIKEKNSPEWNVSECWTILAIRQLVVIGT